MNEDDKIQILRDLLFEDDSIFIQKIAARLEKLEDSFDDETAFSSRVDPLIQHKIAEFKTSIPQTLGPTITEALKVEIKKNKDEVVDALYPVLGKMIKKYVAQEIKKLSESINQRLGFESTIRSWFGRSDEKKSIIDALAAAKIEQVFLIEKESGLLKASYALHRTVDEEMISGMLTAIKSFVEDAFGQKDQFLELIDYELYQIHLQNFQKYYVAVIISGSYTLTTKDKIQNLIFDFYEDFMKKDEYKTLSTERINRELARNFANASL